MSQTASKASGSSKEPRTQARVGMGSHSTFQRAVGRLNRSVLKTKRTYGFCTAPGRQRRAGWRLRETDPLPPPAWPWSVGPPLNFSPFFQPKEKPYE